MKLTCCVFILVCEIVTIVSAQRGGNCQDYGDLPNGKVKVRNKGRVIKFACNKGYVLVGSEIATCIRREWMLSAVTPPLCITNGCKALSVPLNGRLQLDYGGGIARVKCNPGYSFQRDTQVLLFCDGRDWNGTVPTCRATTSLAPTSCDFEEDFCFWQQDAGHNIDWERQRLSTPSGSIGTGPSFDHTRGEGMGGFYIYLEASGTRSVNDSARLYSPYYKAEFSRDSCFIFWYHMYGATMGTLNVYMKPESKEFARSKLLFQQSGNLGNQWIQAILPLDEITENFQIVIEGLRGPSYMSDMAVDDVKLAKGEECLVPSTTQVPETTSKATISPFLSCNGKCGTTPSTSDGNVCSCSPSCLTDFNCCLDYTIYCSETSAGAKTEPAMTSPIQPETVTVVTVTPAATTSSLASVAVTESPTTITLSSTYSTEIVLTSTLQSTNEDATTMPSTVAENTSLFSISFKTNSPSESTKSAEMTTLSSVESETAISPNNTSSQTIQSTTAQILPNSTVFESTVTPEITTVTATVAKATSVATAKTTQTTTAAKTATVPSTTTKTTTSSSVRTTTVSTGTTSTIPSATKTTSSTTQMITLSTRETTAKPLITSKVDFNYVEDTQIASNAISSQSGFQSDVIETSALGGSNIIIVTSVLGLTACATIAVLVTLLRRKRMNEERQGSLPEDSDVRYLHNDEEVQLDFTEQEPKNNRKSMVFGFEKF